VWGSRLVRLAPGGDWRRFGGTITLLAQGGLYATAVVKPWASFSEGGFLGVKVSKVSVNNTGCHGGDGLSLGGGEGMYPLGAGEGLLACCLMELAKTPHLLKRFVMSNTWGHGKCANRRGVPRRVGRSCAGRMKERPMWEADQDGVWERGDPSREGL